MQTRTIVIALAAIAAIALLGWAASRVIGIRTEEPLPTPPSGAASMVRFPTAGSVLEAGQSYSLEWDKEAIQEDTVAIFLINTALESAGTSVAVSDRQYDIPNTGSYEYRVPDSLETGEYRLEIGTLRSAPFRVTSKELSFCNPDDLDGSLMLEGAAGTVNGSVAIQNTGENPCRIIGNAFIKAAYDANGQNISVRQEGITGPETITLEPQAIAYSQLRYQNGPQCSGTTSIQHVTFSYAISPNAEVTLRNQDGATTQPVTICADSEEDTVITVQSISRYTMTDESK